MISIKSLIPNIEVDNKSETQLQYWNPNFKEDSKTFIKDNYDSLGFDDRNKYQKLTDQQTKHIIFKINESNKSIKQISNECQLSRSAVYRIKRLYHFQNDKNKKRKWMKVFGKDKIILIDEIKDFISNIDSLFNWNHVTNHINLKLNKSYQSSWIRWIMKNDLNLTYKRVKPRPNNVDFGKIKACRQLFAIEFSKLVEKSSLVINIDETSINRHIKSNYSWSKKGRTNEAKNSSFIGSINVVMAIWSNGNWFSLLMNNTSDSDNFSMFIKQLNRWLVANNYFDHRHIIITMDNWSIHKCKKIKEILRQMRVDIIYLPAYTPQFAPIEMCFSMLKNKLRNNWNKKVIKLNTQSGLLEIYKGLKSIKSANIKPLFRNMYSAINEYI